MIGDSNYFDLEIIRPTESTLLTVSWVEVEGEMGSFTVGPNHSPIVTILKPGGILSYTTHDGKFMELEISSGVFSVSKGRAVIVFDT